MARANKASQKQLTTMEQLELDLSAITDPKAMLQYMIDNEMYIGGDPYYRDINDAIWKHAQRVVQA